MKHFFILAPILLFHTLLNAQAITIAEARALPEGTTVTVSGTVTNGSELGIIRYFQDGTAGIAAYGGVLESINRNDSITITGKLKDYNGLLEIDPIVSVENHGPAQLEIMPVLATPADINESNEGELLRIDEVVFDDGGGTFENGSYTFSSSSEVGTIYLRNGHLLIGELIPVGPVTLVGIASQFSFSGTGGYQLLPRDQADLINEAPISIISAVEQTNMTTTGFDVTWVTDVPSSTGLWYSTDEHADEAAMDLVYTDESVTEHTVSLTGLESGQVYFVRAFSVTGTDSASTGNNAFVTISESTGQMVALFNKGVDHAVAEPPDNLAVSTTAIWDSVAAWIDKSVTSLDIAIYNFNNSAIANAINAAYDRGVSVRMIVEGSTANQGLSMLNSNIPVLERMNATGSGMHNKFMIIDADDPANAWIMGGSTNFTDYNMSVDFNNMIFIQDQSLARAYRVEFEEMWGGSGNQPDLALSRFGEEKRNNTPHNFVIDGTRVELYFSPTDGTTGKIIETIMDADVTVNFATLVFTRGDIADAVIDRNNDFFVAVSGMINDVNVTGSEYQYLLDNFVPVYSYQNVQSSLHHKYVIVDQGDEGADPVILTGSHNWSSSAENTNDENTLVIHNQLIANQYFQEFKARLDFVVGVEELAPLYVKTWPNPVSGKLYVSDITAGPEVLINITDLTGKTVFSEQINNVNGNTVAIDMTGFDKGLYMVTLSAGNQTTTLKIVKN